MSMFDEYLIHFIVLTSGLLLLASISAIVLKKFNFPYTIGLVIIGIVTAVILHYTPSLSSYNNVVIFHNVIYYILLPILIFDASINLDNRLLTKNLIPIFTLAAPGLVISLVIVAILVNISIPLSLGAAFLFGALISATDPVAVIALFKEIGAPKRLTMLVDGESIFNDATAIVAFNIIAAMIAIGARPDLSVFFRGAVDFMVVFIGGFLVGVVIGIVFLLLMNFSRRDPMVTVTFSVILAYIAFIVSDYVFRFSGVMAVLGAGLAVNWFSNVMLVDEVKEYLLSFWEFSAFAANSFIFLILGLVEWKLILIIWDSHEMALYLLFTIIAVIIARAVVVYGIIPLLKYIPKQEKINKRYRTIIFWGGLRGAVPLALAFSLKPDVLENKLILVLTLGVVLFTLLAQGISTKFLIKIFRLDELSIYDRMLCLQTRYQSLLKGKKMLTRLRMDNLLFFKQPLQEAIGIYDNNLVSVEEKLSKIQKEPGFTIDTLRRLLWYQVTAIEKKTYKKLRDYDLISESVYVKLEHNIESEKDRIKEGQNPFLELEETPIEGMFIKLTNFLAKKVFKRTRLSKWLIYRNIIAEYEITLAQLVVYREIDNLLISLPEIYTSVEQITNECRIFYRIRADRAVNRRKEIRRYVSAFKIKFRYLYKAALVREIDAVEKLFNTGYIPKLVSDNVETEINKELEVARKGIFVRP